MKKLVKETLFEFEREITRKNLRVGKVAMIEEWLNRIDLFGFRNT